MANQGDQAFRSLIETVTKNDPQTNLSPEAITRLTEKLGEIVGYDALNDFIPGQRNARGELLNEEGLPIIDITEAVESEEDANLVEAAPLIPLEQIPTPEREKLRQQRNRILDALEQEERQEEEKLRQKEREEYEELVRKRQKSPANAIERAKRAKELQKKMGKALLRNMADSKEQEEKEEEREGIKDEQADSREESGPPSKKKNVTFADAPDVRPPENETEDWGDVTPGRIQQMKRPSLLSAQTDSQTMKMNVVERHPVRPASPPKPAVPEKDSDDESDEDLILNSHDHSSPPESPNLSADELGSDNELDDETDIDYASLQRRVQFEYHQKRAIIGQDAASLIQTPSESAAYENTEDNLGISKGDPSKPAISQYRASRLVSAYGASNPSSASDFIVPAASAQTLRSAIRVGKLDDDGQLVGGEDDSGDEAENGITQEILELLRRDEVYNVGPNGEPIHVLPQKSPSSSTSKPTPTSSALRLDEAKALPPLKTKPPMSRFKVSRLAVNQSPNWADSHSESNTPINHLERSSPKSQGVTPLPSPATLAPTSPLTIIDSPSYARPTIPGRPSSNPPPAFSMIVESPSFARPTGAPKPPAVAAAVSTQVTERRTNRLERPPTIISSTVREAKPVQKPNVAEEAPGEPSTEPPKKVSRFKRDRMH